MTVASARTPVVLWAGPINAVQAQAATLPGAFRHFFTCTGDGSTPPKCSDWAVMSGGRLLPGLLARAGLREDQVGDIFLGAFSAGGHLWKRLLDIPEDRARIRGAMLHDSAYEIGTQKDPKYVEGFVKFGLDVLKDPSKFLLMTASITPNTPRPGEYYQSGADTMRATIAEIAKRAGRAIEEGGSLPAGVPAASRLWKPSKNAIFAQYDNIGHAGLALNSGLYWQHVLQPWLDKGQSETDSDWLVSAIMVALGAATGYAGASFLED